MKPPAYPASSNLAGEPLAHNRRCCVALGGNLGDVPATFQAAIRLLEPWIEPQSLQISRNYRSLPMGTAAGAEFWNAAVTLTTRLTSQELLRKLREIEAACGRQRGTHWGPRTLDLDIIYYGSLQCVTAELTIPHPGRIYRRFVLDPICDIAPDWIDPQWSLPVAELQSRLAPRPLAIQLPVKWPENWCWSVKQQLGQQSSEVEFVTVASNRIHPPALVFVSDSQPQSDRRQPPQIEIPAGWEMKRAVDFVVAAALAALSIPVPVEVSADHPPH